MPSALPPSASHAGPLDGLRQPRVLMWVLLTGECLALVLASAPGASGNRWVYFGLASLSIQWIALLALGMLYALRSHVTHLSPHRLAWLALAVLIGATWLVSGAAWVLLGDLASGESGWWFVARATAITLSVGLLGLAAFQNYWRGRELARLAQQAELAALHARIQPHFLFNTLNTAIALVRARPGAAEQVLLDLADLFRVALASPRELALAQELELARRYLAIEQLRLGGRLAVRWSVPETLPDILVPALSVQPLVENAVRHGIERRPDGGCVEVEVEVADAGVRVTVRNPLPPAGAGDGGGHRIGQSAVRARLEGAGTGARLDTAEEGGHYVATLTLPRPAQATTR